MSNFNTPGIIGYPVTTTGNSTSGNGIVVVPNTGTYGGSGPYQPSLQPLYPYPYQPYPYESNPAIVSPLHSEFMSVKANLVLQANGKPILLNEALSLCKNIKYLIANDEIVLHKPVWDAIFTYMKNEDGYAGMTPSEYLDKIFTPKSAKCDDVAEQQLGTP